MIVEMLKTNIVLKGGEGVLLLCNMLILHFIADSFPRILRNIVFKFKLS